MIANGIQNSKRDRIFDFQLGLWVLNYSDESCKIMVGNLYSTRQGRKQEVLEFDTSTQTLLELIKQLKEGGGWTESTASY